MKNNPKKLANLAQSAIDKVSVANNSSKMPLDSFDSLDRKAERALKNSNSIQQVTDALAGLSKEAWQQTIEWISFAKRQVDSVLNWDDLMERLNGMEEDQGKLRERVLAFDEHLSAVESEDITPLPPSGVKPTQTGTVQSIWGVYGSFPEDAPEEKAAG